MKYYFKDNNCIIVNAKYMKSFLSIAVIGLWLTASAVYANESVQPLCLMNPVVVLFSCDDINGIANDRYNEIISIWCNAWST